MNAAHFVAALLLLNVFQETGINPLSTDVFYTSRWQQDDELPQCDATWTNGSVHEVSATCPAWPKTAHQDFWGEREASETSLMVVSTMCDELGAPQQSNETAIILVSARSSGFVATQDVGDTALAVISNICGVDAAPEGDETALVIPNTMYYYDTCPAIPSSETKALAIWSKREAGILMILCVTILCCISITGLVFTIRTYLQILRGEVEEYEIVEVIIFVFIPPVRADYRRHG